MDSAQVFAERVSAICPQPWRLEVVDTTGSTNADLVARARTTQCEAYTVLVALEQTEGRGRLERSWSTPGGQSVAMSMCVPLGEDPALWGLIPIATGVGVVRALKSLGVDARLKWPNDVLIADKKVCGILVELAGGSAVIGVGINVTGVADFELPHAISLETAGAMVAREQVVSAVLAELGPVLGTLQTPDGRAALLRDYRSMSCTLSTQVRIHIGDDWVEGMAIDIAHDGQLLVNVGGDLRTFASGDVHHLR